MTDLRGRRPATPRLFLALGLASGIVACGGGSTPTAAPTPLPPPTTLTPTRLADLSAEVSSPDADSRFNCQNEVRARVAVINRGATSVEVSGVRKTSAITSGHCSAPPQFTYTPLNRFAAPGNSTVLLDRALYASGTGCCSDPAGCGGICGAEERFEVVTGLGVLPAGSFTYAVTFKNCPTCRPGAASAVSCVPLESDDSAL